MRISYLFAVVALIGFLAMGYMHEQVHVQIMKSYGIESHIEYFSHFPDFVTVANEGCPTEECKLAHNINEAISYPLLPIYIVIATWMLIILVFVEETAVEYMKSRYEVKA